MLRLGGPGLEIRNLAGRRDPFILRVTDHADRPPPLRRAQALLAKGEALPAGFNLYMAVRSKAANLDQLPASASAIVLPDEYDYLSHGDIVRIQPTRKAIRVLYRRSSPHNTFLTTERCNHYCLTCSQPPKEVDDSWIVGEILDAIPLIDPATVEIGLSGGEPTLLGDDLFRILRTSASYLPRTAIHILSNGRMFSDVEFARQYAEIRHPDIMVGIPIYSDLSSVHDYVVQADGAFDEPIRGILNLKRFRQRVEIRVVIHKQTYQRLPQLAEFLARNLTFVDQVALMGLEMTGFTKPNLSDLWIDPVDCQRELYLAATLLADYRMNVSIYSHQLCVLDRRLAPGEEVDQ